MSCGSCSKRRMVRRATQESVTSYDLAGGVDIKSLNDRQINARLEIFKRKFCKDCNKRYECNYGVYLGCKGLVRK